MKLLFSILKKDNYTIKHIILNITLLVFVLNIYWIIFFDSFINTFQYLWILNIFGYYIYLGLDGISLSFTFLTSFFIPLCILFLWNTKINYIVEYYICLMCIELLLLIVFLVLDLFIFYITFEAILIPFFLLIGMHGTRIRKIHASYLLFFYTVCGSIWMLLSIIYIYIHTGTSNIQLLWSIKYNNITEHLLWFSFILSFSVKVPIFPFHIWLPEAHVESPTEGSVILAAILLKIGIYGFLRFVIPMFSYITYYYSNIIILINILSILYTSIITLRQIDIKRIIAYSSIGHMNICMLGIMYFDITSIIGSFIIMIGHGFISGGLFFLIGMLYDRFKTKIVYYYSGIYTQMPLFSTFFFFFTLSNISMPLTSNFIGELLILYKIISDFNTFILSCICISIFLCTIYSIWLYNRISYGLIRNIIATDLNMLEVSIIMPIIICVLAVGIYPNILIQLLTSNIYYYFFF